MRLIAAIISFVIAFAMIAFGIAQRTVFAEPDNITASAVTTSAAPVTLIDSSTLRSVPGRQGIDVSGADNVFAAYGRTEDVLAWVGKASYNTLSYDPARVRLVSKLVKGEEATVPDPHNSDLWLDEYSRARGLNFTVNVPDGITVILISDGTQPAPTHVSIRWPLDNRTPWSGPLIVGGVLLLAVGIALYLWELAYLRRVRGPQRKTPKMPKVPKQKGYKQPRRPKPATTTGRRSARRMVAVVPVLLIGTLSLSGCSPDLWPEFMGGSSASTPAPTSTVIAPVGKDLQAPAVTVPQLKIIVSRIATVAAKADADKNIDLLKTRFVGPALDLRTANYGIRKVDGAYAPPAVIPTGDVELTLPQQSDTWPRTVFTVVQNPADATVPPIALMLVQESARVDFKVNYAVALEAKAVLPDVAPANVGAPRLPPDSKLLLLPPSKLAMAYGDLLEKGVDASEYAKYFDLKTDTLIPLIGLDARKALQAALPARAAMTFANSQGLGESIALGSNDSGAVVSVDLNETVAVTPTEAGAAVNPEGAVKSLSGVTGSTKGTTAIYGDQLLFYVPPASSKQKIRLLGFATGLISAKEIP